jgi:putative FmdB family regulatory protein
MPLYEYECDVHGVFEMTRSMAEAREAARCASCRRFARRILSATRVWLVDRSERVARDVNEKSRNEPRVERRTVGPSPGAERPRKRMRSRGRPWALEHG